MFSEINMTSFVKRTNLNVENALSKLLKLERIYHTQLNEPI